MMASSKNRNYHIFEIIKYLLRSYILSLAAHFQTQHGVKKGVPGQEVEGKGRGDKPRTYRMAF